MEQDVIRVQLKYFNKWTKLYNTLALIRYPTASALRVLRQALRAHYAFNTPQQKVFEFGFGHGHALFSFPPPAAIYGVELSDLALTAAAERARKLGYREYTFKKARTEDSVLIDFPANEFDVVLCSHTIEHVADDEGLLAELYRVTRPGGRVFLLAPLDVHSTSEVLSRDLRRNPDFPERSFHVWQYNLRTLEHLMHKAGFYIIQAVALDAVWDWRLSWPRPIQILTSLIFMATPYKVWEQIDRLAVRLGYHPKQALLVASK